MKGCSDRAIYFVSGGIMTKRKVPEIKLKDYTAGTSDQKRKFADDLYTGLKEYGFIILTDHNVNTKLLDKAYSMLKTFYALPTEVKESYISPSGKGQRGYTAFGEEHAKDSDVHDLKEFWHVGRQVSENHAFKKYYPDNIWPDQHLTEFREVFTTLYNDLNAAGVALLTALSEKLDVPENYFKDMVHDGNSILRLLHYPPIKEGTDPRCIRAAAHEDINLITLLVAATSSGLQLKDRDGTWLNVDTDANNLIVDAGDMLARICNDVIPSTTHRVINTPEAGNSSRYSMPFFMHPHPEATLTCIPSCRGEGEKYEPISSHEFLMQRLKEIGLTK